MWLSVKCKVRAYSLEYETVVECKVRAYSLEYGTVVPLRPDSVVSPLHAPKQFAAGLHSRQPPRIIPQIEAFKAN